jgi:hypothetical protein
MPDRDATIIEASALLITLLFALLSIWKLETLIGGF